MYHLTSHLRLNAVYWGLTALCVMKHKEALGRDELIEFVMSCWDEKAGALFMIYIRLTSDHVRYVQRFVTIHGDHVR